MSNFLGKLAEEFKAENTRVVAIVKREFDSVVSNRFDRHNVHIRVRIVGSISIIGRGRMNS